MSIRLKGYLKKLFKIIFYLDFNEYTTFIQVNYYFPESRVRNNVNFAIGK